MSLLYVFFLLIGAISIKFLIGNSLDWLERKKKFSKFKTPYRHWLFGVSNVIGKDPKKSLLLIRKWVNELMQIGENVGVFWFIYIPQIIIFNSKDAEAVISGAVDARKGLCYTGLMPWLGQGLLTSEGSKWHRRRKTLTPAFHFKMLPHFVKVFNEKGKSLVQKLELHVNQDIDIIPFISEFTFESVCETTMGLSSNTTDINIVEDYHKAIADFGAIVMERLVNPWMFFYVAYIFTRTYWRERRLVKFLHKVSRQVIHLRKKQFENFMNLKGSTFDEYAGKKTLSMLDILLLAQKENENLNDEDIREEVDTFMFEGHDTTLLCLTFTLMLLANNKKHQERIYEEILHVIGTKKQNITANQLNELTVTEMCIKESLRLYPSVPMITRTVQSDVHLSSGKIIPSRTDCVIDFWGIHRDPTLYPNPEQFDPDRFSLDNITKRGAFAYLPFSAGPRNCIGQKMAMLEVKCALVYILQNFKLDPIDSPESIEFLFDIVLRPSGPVRMKLVPRNY